MVYNDERRVAQFAHRLLLFLKSKEVDSIFLIVKQEMGSELVKTLSTVSKIREVKK